LVAFAIPTAADAQRLVGSDWEFSLGTGFGWAAAFPDAMLGAGVFHIFEGTKWGILAEAKIPHDSNKRSPDYQGDLTLEAVFADFPEEKRIEIPPAQEEWRLLNVALIRALTPESALYLGGGFAQKSVVREFGDNSEAPLTRSGFYFVEDGEETGWHPNVIGGVLLRGGDHIAFTAGFESAPLVLSLGIYYVIR